MITEKDGSGLFSNSHKYINGGIYDVKVSLSDDDSGSITQSTKAMITGVGMKDGTLYIIGTDSADHVSVNRDRKGLKVHADFLPDRGHFRTFNAAEIQRIEIYLGDGNDHATIADNIDLPVFIDGGAGNDHLNAGRGPAMLVGGDGNDKLIGSRADDRIFGGNGNDVIFGSGGNDLLDGGAGNDIVYGSWGNDTILGGDGKDVIFGDGGNDTIDAGAGNDLVFGGWGDDTITGGAGNDVIFGGSGSDKLNGSDGDDRLYGGCGNDVLDGGNGNDRLFGGAGNDLLVGGTGHDTLDGGPGADILIDGGSVRVGKTPLAASKKSHGLIDLHASYGDYLPGGHCVGAGSHLSSPSWVRQFVVDLATYGLDPNGDISIVIPSSLDPQLRSC